VDPTKALPEQKVYFDPETAGRALPNPVFRGGRHYSYRFVLTPTRDFMCFKQSNGETCRPETAARCASDGDLGSTVDFYSQTRATRRSIHHATTVFAFLG